MNLRKMDLNLLLVFNTVYETRSNTKAAQRLGLTQSAVSNALGRLRGHLGDPLFERKGADFVPTETARKLAPEISAALRAIERTLHAGQDFDPHASQRRFSLVTMDPIETLLVPHLAQTIIDRGYSISLECVPFPGLDLPTALESGKVDIHFQTHATVSDDCNSTYIYQEEIVFLCRADHPRYGNTTQLKVADLAEAPLIAVPETLRRYTHLEHEAREKQITRRHLCLVGRLTSIPPLIAQSDMIGALPERMARYSAEAYNLRVIPVVLDRPAHQWHMVWHQQMEDDPGHRWMRNQIKAYYNV